ncbi:hypothetical protein D3C87_1247060 [compost metagenome]
MEDRGLLGTEVVHLVSQRLIYWTDEAVLDRVDGRLVLRQTARGGNAEHPFTTVTHVGKEYITFFRNDDTVDVSRTLEGHVLGVTDLRRLQRISNLQLKTLDELVLLEDRMRVTLLQTVVVVLTTQQAEVIDSPALTSNVSSQLIEPSLAGVDRSTDVSLRLHLYRFIHRLADGGVNIRNHWNWHSRPPCFGSGQLP